VVAVTPDGTATLTVTVWPAATFTAVPTVTLQVLLPLMAQVRVVPDPATRKVNVRVLFAGTLFPFCA
jgi:hypothetical protein